MPAFCLLHYFSDHNQVGSFCIKNSNNFFSSFTVKSGLEVTHAKKAHAQKAYAQEIHFLENRVSHKLRQSYFLLASHWPVIYVPEQPDSGAFSLQRQA